MIIKKLMQKISNIPSIIMALCFMIASASCVQSSQIYSRISEQSRETPPDWLDLGSTTEGAEYVFVKKKDRVFDLPLGLLQAQEGAILSLQIMVRDQILKHASSQNALNAAEIRSIDKELSKILPEEVNTDNVRDIYFERMMTSGGGPFADYYRIFILTKLEKPRMAKIVSKLQNNLEATGSVKVAAVLRSFENSSAN